MTRVVRMADTASEARRMVQAAHELGATVRMEAVGTWEDSKGELLFAGAGGCEVRTIGRTWLPVHSGTELLGVFKPCAEATTPGRVRLEITFS